MKHKYMPDSQESNFPQVALAAGELTSIVLNNHKVISPWFRQKDWQ